MKRSDKAIISGVGVLVLALAFYFMVLSPKRQQAAELNDQISDLKASISQEEQVASFGEQARQDFPRYYGRLVVLGKAVPEQADTPSLLVQLNSLAGRSGVQFRGISLSGGGDSGTGTSSSGAAAAPAAPATSGTSTTPASGSTTTPATSTPASSTSGDSATSSSSTSAAPASTATAAAPATETDAASQPLGAVVGPAGLPTLPYDLTFKGGFFGIANFIGGVDSLVDMREESGQVAANGRLFTVDGFALKGGAPGSNPILDASFRVTSYVAPSAQGLTAGASPSGPAPANPAQPQTTPTSAGTVAP
jgi:Tfp pilus assembly protein PilO